MEKIKIGTYQYDIVGIEQHKNQLKIVFPEPVNLKGDLSKIELYTAGGVCCATFTGYTTIYNVTGPVVILSKDGSTQPVTEPPVETEPPGGGTSEEPGPSEIELRFQEIFTELGNLSNAIVMMSMMSLM